MRFIYTLIIALYYSGIRLFSLWNRKARLWTEGRKNWEDEFRKIISRNVNWIWFHCSSLGEFEDGRTVIEAIKNQYPKYKILLTFFSPSGLESRKKYAQADLVTYLPRDYPKHVTAFLNILSPKAIFFIRNEIWINYIFEIKKRGLPLYLISAVIGHKSDFFLFPAKILYKKAFHRFNGIFSQDVTTNQFLSEKFGITGTKVTGNTRVDRVISIAARHHDEKEIMNFSRDYFCVIAGSVMLRDIGILTESIKMCPHKGIRWIIVPHEVNGKTLLKIEKKFPRGIIMHSRISELQPKHRILCIDNIGMLAKIYRHADIAFVGGGFTKAGIHNILEPAVYGLPVAFGPNHRNYREALHLVHTGGASIINNSGDLSSFVLRFYHDKQLLEEIKKKNSSYIHSCGGATARILEIIKKENIL